MKSNKRYDLAEIARRLLKLNTRSTDGGFDAYIESHYVRSVMLSAVDFPRDIPEADRVGIVISAMDMTRAEGALNGESLEAALRRAEGNYLKRPREALVIASSLNVRPFSALRRAQVDGTAIRFGPTLPPRFDRKPIASNLEQHTRGHQPWPVTHVRVEIAARSHVAAFEQGMERLDFLRALWNLRANRTKLFRSSSGRREAINSIRLGPVHTVHTRDGKLASEMYWYEREENQCRSTVHLEPEWKQVRRWTADARALIAHIPYAERFKELIVQYGRALDFPDLVVAYNRLWAVLEHLVDSVGAYDQLVRRTRIAFPRNEHGFSRLLVEHLRDVRNGIIHADRSPRDMETYLFQLKDVVERLMMFHFRRGSRFASLAEAGSFLDLPSDPEVLKKRISTLRLALRLSTR